MKFSIIIPVYNVEKFLDRCLKSVFKQNYKNYEVIIVNDGSPDKSNIIINKYIKKDEKFKVIDKKNGGISSARNAGIEKASGDYILFIDGDDYIEPDLLLKINDYIDLNKNIEVVRFSSRLVTEEGEVIENSIIKSKDVSNGNKYFTYFVESKIFFDTVWLYAYNLKFWKKNKFQFCLSRIHEDFGLIPEIILKSKKIGVIDYIGYNYVQSNNSIIRNFNKEKEKKKCVDLIYFYDKYQKLPKNIFYEKKTKKMFDSFCANALILKATTIKDKENFKWYLKELKFRKLHNKLLNDTFSRKLKIIIYKISPRLIIQFQKPKININ